MTKHYKAQLTETNSHAAAAKSINEWLSANVTLILDALHFHEDHGRIGDHDGKFDKQTGAWTVELIAEIAAVLAEAWLESVPLKHGQVIATLREIAADPSRALDPKLPGQILWMLAINYQRADEKPGTHWSDVIHIFQKGSAGDAQPLSFENIKAAAELALQNLQANPPIGRPLNFAIQTLALKLAPIFLRYRDRIGRICEHDNFGGADIYTERGEFLEFLRTVLPPLDKLLCELRLAPVTPDSIVRLASELYPRKA